MPILDDVIEQWEIVANKMIKKFLASPEYTRYVNDVMTFGVGQIDIGKWVTENIDDTDKT